MSQKNTWILRNTFLQQSPTFQTCSAPSMLWSSFYFSTVWHVCGVNGRRKWFDLSQNGRCLTGHLYTARGMIRIFQNQLHWYFCDPKSPWYLFREGFKKSKWKFKMAFAMKGGGGGGSRPVSSATYLFWKMIFVKNHLESFPDCENVLCT